MKKLLVALLTFVVGITAFNLLKTKQVSTTTTFTSEQKAVVNSEFPIKSFPSKNVPTKKIENLEPFFDSFSLNEFENSEYQGYNGWFIADDFKGMPEVWTILLNRNDENSKDEKLTWSAMILTQYPDYSSNDDDNFQSVWIKTEGNHLSFKTNKIRGIEYKFDGKFFKNGNNFSNNEKVLKGTLQKIVKGKQVAKITADFAYYEPHCFH